MVNDEDNVAHIYADIFNCQIGYFPIKYLRVPVSPSRLHVIDWLPLMEKNLKDWTFGREVPCALLEDPP